MKIDIYNANVINTNNVNIHDYIFEKLEFIYSEKNIYITLSNFDSEQQSKIIVFYDVVGINMVSCDFWGRSLYVLDWEFVDGNEKRLINKLFETKECHKYVNSTLEKPENYIETNMTLSSGDVLTIACRYIDLLEDRCCFEEHGEHCY